MSIITNYTIQQIAEILKASAYTIYSDSFIKHLSIDSRVLMEASETLFFAIVAQRDGHQYLENAYQNGIRNFVISKDVDFSCFPEANWIKVDDTVIALQSLAKFHRQQFSFPIIAITGSNGKTIVKEWIYQMLSPDFNIIRSPKSYNSQIGVPLSLWQIQSWHNLGIFEAGISTRNEMQQLEAIIQPKIGILTNINEAHNEGFKSKLEKLEEKLKLFIRLDIFIYRSEDLSSYTGKIPGKNSISWGYDKKADFYIQQQQVVLSNTELIICYDNQIFNAVLPFTDQASIENAITCWLCLLCMGYSSQEIIKRLQKLNKIEMRLQLLNGIDQCSLIDDSYSADIPSLAIALDFLNQQNQHDKRTLILSDLLETGKEDILLYSEIAELVKQKKVDRFIGVGEKLEKFQDLFPKNSSFYINTDDLLKDLLLLRFNHETILIKGARKFQFEQITNKLALKIHDTVLEINLNAMLSNLHFYQQKLNEKVKTMVMVKAFSYGSGSFEIANLLQYHKVDYLAVAYIDEGIALRKAGINLPIMVMNPEANSFKMMQTYQLEPEIYSLELFKELLAYLSLSANDFKIHLKLDTGMHRLGFEKHQIGELKKLLIQNDKIKIASVFSHLVASDDKEHDDFTKLQFSLFNKLYQELVSVLSDKPLKHILNTSGITRWKSMQMDMVRLGIGLYGFDAVSTEGLHTVATLKTSISQIKQLAAGETVGYSRKGILPYGGTIATVRIGYADGYSRLLGNGNGQMLVNGILVPTIGSICMDMCMLDISAIEANIGDEVIVFNEQLTIQNLATAAQTIPYEILTNVSQRVKRVYYFE